MNDILPFPFGSLVRRHGEFILTYVVYFFVIASVLLLVRSFIAGRAKGFVVFKIFSFFSFCAALWYLWVSIIFQIAWNRYTAGRSDAFDTYELLTPFFNCYTKYISPLDWYLYVLIFVWMCVKSVFGRMYIKGYIEIILGLLMVFVYALAVSLFAGLQRF